MTTVPFEAGVTESIDDGLAVRIVVVREHVDRRRGVVLVHRRRVVGHGRVVGRAGERDGDAADVGAAPPVRDRVVEPRRAAQVRGRLEPDRPADDRDRSAGRSGDRAHREGVAVGVRVVRGRAARAGDGQLELDVLGRGCGVVDRDGSEVLEQVRDRDREALCEARPASVGDLDPYRVALLRLVVEDRVRPQRRARDREGAVVRGAGAGDQAERVGLAGVRVGRRQRAHRRRGGSVLRDGRRGQEDVGRHAVLLEVLAARPDPIARVGERTVATAVAADHVVRECGRVAGVERVAPVAAVEMVVARARPQRVTAQVAAEHVRSGRAQQRVVARAAA